MNHKVGMATPGISSLPLTKGVLFTRCLPFVSMVELMCSAISVIGVH